MMLLQCYPISMLVYTTVYTTTTLLKGKEDGNSNILLCILQHYLRKEKRTWKQ